MSPERVPAEWVEKALIAAFKMPEEWAAANPGVMNDLKVAYGDQYRAALAAVLPLAQAAILSASAQHLREIAAEMEKRSAGVLDLLVNTSAEATRKDAQILDEISAGLRGEGSPS